MQASFLESNGATKARSAFCTHFCGPKRTRTSNRQGGRHTIIGSPWVGGREQRYREQSPITYASRIRTPTLILHDTKDARVTVTQSYKLYHALRDNGVPVKFFAYPVPGHFPGDPVRARDVYSRWLEWLDQYLSSAVSAK